MKKIILILVALIMCKENIYANRSENIYTSSQVVLDKLWNEVIYISAGKIDAETYHWYLNYSLTTLSPFKIKDCSDIHIEFKNGVKVHLNTSNIESGYMGATISPTWTNDSNNTNELLTVKCQYEIPANILEQLSNSEVEKLTVYFGKEKRKYRNISFKIVNQVSEIIDRIEDKSINIYNPIQLYSNDEKLYVFDGPISILLVLTEVDYISHYYAADISVINNTDSIIEINPSLIKCYIQNNNEYNQEIKKFTYKEIQRLINKKENIDIAVSSILGATNSIAAALSGPQIVAQTNSTITDQYDNKVRVSTNIKDYNLSQKIVDQTSLTLHTISEMYNNARSNVSDGYLKRNSIFPGNRVDGYIFMDYKKADRVIVKVPIGNIIYNFECIL